MALFAKKPVPPSIRRVKFMGVRTAEETKILGTYNSSMYCFLIEYDNGERKLVEYQADDKALPELLGYIDMGPLPN